MDMKGKTAFVTGGTRGIGKEIVLALAQAGANVAVMTRGGELVDSPRNGIGDKKLLYIRGDVGEMGDVLRAVDLTISSFGAIDVLVNNAGISVGADIFQISEEDWWADLRVNLGGAFHTCKSIAPLMKERGRGSIVNISSQAARFGSKKPNYSASKAGLIGLTKSLARTLGPHNVRANAILPGVTDTDLIGDWDAAKREMAAARVPLGRIGTAGEVAQVALFLASDASSYVNGTSIDVHGGEPL